MLVSLPMSEAEQHELAIRARVAGVAIYDQLVHECCVAAAFICPDEAQRILEAINDSCVKRFQLNDAYLPSVLQHRMGVLVEKYPKIAASRLLRFVWLFGVRIEAGERAAAAAAVG